MYYNYIINKYYKSKSRRNKICWKKYKQCSRTLNLPLSKVTPDAKIVEDLGADSLDVVELLSRLEDEYGVVIPDDDVENLKTVADVAAELEKIMK